MAKSPRLQVMISSRCNDTFPEGQPGAMTLSEIRRALKKSIEAEGIFGKQVFDVWINEESPPQGGKWDSWEVCLEAVKDCDILIALSNGNAGWAATSADIGICHDELSTAYSRAPAKVRLISLGNVACDKSEQGVRNRRFQEYVAEQSPFRGGEVRTVDDLHKRVKEAVFGAVINLAQSGVQEASKGRYYMGQALDWSRLDFADRQATIVAVLEEAMRGRPGTSVEGDSVFARIKDKEILVVTHAVPAAMSISAAREMVGQPFLKDYLSAPVLTGSRGGPLHLIACHKTIGEMQALRMLGFADAVVISAPFGIYVADNVQKIQISFLTNCRDEATTRHGLQRFFTWLEQTGEGVLVGDRAIARARIVKALAKEQK
jgi:Domain of unknown function (DUF4062)